MKKLNVHVDTIAKICHEANRAYCQSHGDLSQAPWEEAPDWQKNSARSGVILHLTGDHGPQASHENWMREKVEAGWVYGAEKDETKKTHPCLISFADLPPYQQMKDHLFVSVVKAFKDLRQT